MSAKASEQIISLNSHTLRARVFLIVFILFTLAFGWFAIRWRIGNLLATRFTDITDENAGQIAEQAYAFAPSDPKTSLLLAKIGNEGDTASADKIYRAVRLSPYDYRLWIDFARASERAGQTVEAERAFSQAVILSPNYSATRWYFGNFLLRQNRLDEAFAELKKSAEGNAEYHQQVFALAWRLFDEDSSRIEAAVGSLPSVRAGLAKFYAAKGRPEDSLRIWNSLSEEDKKSNTEGARVIARALYDKQLFRAAIEFVRQLEIESEAQPETVSNASFEKPIGAAEDAFFDWKIAPVERMDVKLDPTQKREGSRSLRVSFNGYAQPSLSNVYQIVTVEPKAPYRLSFWVRTENLKSGGTPQLIVFNVNENKIIASSVPYPVGTNDWRQLKIDFNAPEKAEAIALLTTRAYCGDNCPIFGAFWYDDFRLEKLTKN